MWSNRNSLSLQVGMQNGEITLEDSLVVSDKTKHTLTIQFSDHFPCYFPKYIGSFCLHRNLCKDIYRSFIDHCKTWRQP